MTSIHLFCLDVHGSVHKNTDHDNCNPLPPKKNKKLNLLISKHVTAASTPYLLTQRTDTTLCNYMYTHDFGLPPRGKRDLGSSGMLRVFIGQAVLVCLTWTAWPFQTGPICCLETSIPKYQSTTRNIPQEREPQMYKHLIIFLKK
jgi:hypothetical protein